MRVSSDLRLMYLPAIDPPGEAELVEARWMVPMRVALPAESWCSSGCGVALRFTEPTRCAARDARRAVLYDTLTLPPLSQTSSGSSVAMRARWSAVNGFETLCSCLLGCERWAYSSLFASLCACRAIASFVLFLPKYYKNPPVKPACSNASKLLLARYAKQTPRKISRQIRNLRFVDYLQINPRLIQSDTWINRMVAHRTG